MNIIKKMSGLVWKFIKVYVMVKWIYELVFEVDNMEMRFFNIWFCYLYNIKILFIFLFVVGVMKFV